MVKLITLDEMKAALRRAVEERGEGWVYPRNGKWRIDGVCRYRLENGSPACIIGLALSYLRPGVVLPENTDASVALKGMASSEAQYLADDVQHNQDGGMPWGEALAMAEANL